METEGVRRRMNIIASHFALHHVLPIYLHPTSASLQNCRGSSLDSLTPRRDNRLYFARQGSASQAFFMKQANSEKQLSSTSTHQEQPLFSRPTNMNSNLPSTSTKNPIEFINVGDHPTFARPNTKNLSYYSCKVEEGRPRMDIVECVEKYVVRVQVGGVDINQIWVEVDDHNLMIKGKRPKQIMEGCFNIVCPLPFDANKLTISAEFQDGYLRVNIPKC